MCTLLLQVIHDICTKMALNYNAGGLPWPWSWLRIMLCPPKFQDTTAGGQGREQQHQQALGVGWCWTGPVPSCRWLHVGTLCLASQRQLLVSS